MVVAVGYDLGSAYQIGASTDQALFVRFLFEELGRRLAEGLMTDASIEVVVAFALALERETPSVLWGQHQRISSGSEIVQRAIDLALPSEPVVAYRALRGIRQDLHGENIRMLKPVARAALAQELRKLGCAVMGEWHHRFIDSDVVP